MRGEAGDVLPLEVEAGETYYVSASISMGAPADQPDRAPSGEASFPAVAGTLARAE